MQCPKCFQEVSEGDKFCSQCGTRFTKKSKSMSMRVLLPNLVIILIVVISTLYQFKDYFTQSQPALFKSSTPFEIVDLQTGWSGSSNNGMAVDYPALSFKIKNTSSEPITNLVVQVSFVDPIQKQQIGQNVTYLVNYGITAPLAPGYTSNVYKITSDHGMVEGGTNRPNMKAVIEYKVGFESNFHPLQEIDIEPKFVLW